MRKKLIYIFSTIILSACTFLDAPPSGDYTDENIFDYPKIVRGFIDHGYDALCKHYVTFYYTKGDCVTDIGVLRDPTHPMRRMSHGTMDYVESYGDLYMIWNDCYQGIRYANMFLKDDKGLNTRFYEDLYSSEVYARTLQGDAYALRAWHHYMLLRQFGGMAENGQMMGVPIMTEPADGPTMNEVPAKRNTFDECVEQILRDCDSALVYLPLANKDFLRETNETTVCTGSIRHRKLDRVSVTALKAFVYLAWASPAFCKDQAKARERYDNAAKCAYEVFHHKMTKEYYKNIKGGYDPEANFLWSDSDSPEILFVSQGYYASIVERTFYPSGFGGFVDCAPTQEMVDSYPMANGYPITDPRSGYDPDHPYDNRDPRFYCDIHFDRSQIIRGITGEPMYTFEIADNGKDAIGQEGTTSPTGYYIKKFTYNNYNPYDINIDDGYKSVFYMRVNHMLAIFAEAANMVVGPLDSERYGMSAKEALGIIRRKTTYEGVPGLGAKGDPYLDECAAAGRETFDKLVREERKVEFCWEGLRGFDLRRWGDLETWNKPVHGVRITTREDGSKVYEHPEVDYRAFPSLWFPISYKEMRRSGTMIQNEGWEDFR